NTSYNRDNGRFECRIKAKGTGADVHQEFYNLTVLTAPHPPMVTPGNLAVATEEKPLELTCSSIGGSPDPMITWYREGSTVPLQSYALKGGSKNHYTNATLQIVPRRADDGAKYKCVVWNRAMPEGHMLETSVSLNVNLGDYPRVEVGPQNPLRVERDHVAKLECRVDAKPMVSNVRWSRNGQYVSATPIHTIYRVNRHHAGKYTCSADNEHAGNYICRSVNIMQPFSSKRVEGVGNSTVALLVRHRPGQAYITPNKPVVHVGNGVTLTCSANPPGWPVPQYRWFRDMDAHLGSEGKYHCHAVNELGIGKIATIILEVHQPPQFLAKLQQHMTRRVGDVDYAVTCSAKGKPTPQIRWIKDGTEILPTRKMTTPTDAGGGVVAVQSILRFRGKARPNGNQLLPNDRGLYTCLYENDVNSANSSMHLRIEHEPIIIHQYNKVAYDLRESAEHSDYGEYICRAVNPLDSIRAPVRLQPKGAPEKPTNLKILEVGHNYAVLNWQPGFNGGFMSTKYLVSYRRVATPREQTLSECSVPPVYALNTKGTSGYSNEILATTKVSKIPPPLHVSYDPNSHVLGINVAATCLSLIAVVESLVTRDATVPIETTFKEAVISHMSRPALYTTATTSGRSLGAAAVGGGSHLGEDRTMALAETAGPGPVVRVKLCLRSNHEHCGAYANAEIGKSYMPHNSSMTTSALVAIVIASLSFIIFLALLYAFCRCRRRHASKKESGSAVGGGGGGGASNSTANPGSTGAKDGSGNNGSGGQHQHSNGYGYHVTSAIGVDSDSYQVLPSAANSSAAPGSHGHASGHGHAHGHGHGLGTGDNSSSSNINPMQQQHPARANLTNQPTIANTTTNNYNYNNNNHSNNSTTNNNTNNCTTTLKRSHLGNGNRERERSQIYVERPPSAFSGLVDYSGYSPHIPTVTSSLSQQSFSPTQQLAPHEMLQAAHRYGTLRKSGKQPPLPPQRKDLQQQAKPPQQMADIIQDLAN
ncbi:hypothetical protein M5D96_004039, partial [Drosophila gunungcola]